MKPDRNKGVPKDQMDEIHLIEESLLEFGYARFCYPEEKEEIINHGYRTVSLGKNADGSVEFRKIFMPQKYLISLFRSKEKKLVHQENYHIEEIGVRSDALKVLCKRAGWNQTEQDLDELLHLSGHSYYMAKMRVEEVEIPLGSGALVNLGDHISWISMILVHPEVRRQGIAASLMYHCLRSATPEGVQRIVGLDATPYGKNLYIQMGFEKSFSIGRCSVSTDLAHSDITGISTEPCNHFDTIRDYLHQRGFENRDLLFRSLLRLSEGRSFVARDNKKIKGLVMSRPGALKPYIGPIIADNENVAKRLLAEVLEYWKKKQIEQVLMDVPFERLNRGLAESAETGPVNELPFMIENGFLKGSHMLRIFDRMYQLISRENKTAVFNYLSENFPRETEIANMLERSENNYSITRAYLQKEKDEMLRYQYAIGGPEFS